MKCVQWRTYNLFSGEQHIFNPSIRALKSEKPFAWLCTQGMLSRSWYYNSIFLKGNKQRRQALEEWRRWKIAPANLIFESSPACLNTFIAELLPRAERSTMGKKMWWTIHLRKFGYDIAYARPPARTHASCKPMSNVTKDLAQLDSPLSYVSHPYEYD